MGVPHHHNVAIGFSSLISGLLSIPLIYIYSFQWDASTTCLKIPYLPGAVLGSPAAIIALGASTAAVAAAGFVAGFWRIRGLTVFYLVAMLVPMTLLGLLVGFLFLTAGGVSSDDRPSLAPTGHRLDGFPGWIRVRVESVVKWEGIKGCLTTTAKVCAELEQIYRIPQDYFNARITPLQAGCCKPPTECGFSYGGPTYWSLPNNTAAGMDCLLWSNNQTQLCFACDSCKAGMLANLAREWRRKAYFLLAFFCASLLLYFSALCFFLATNKTHNGK